MSRAVYNSKTVLYNGKIVTIASLPDKILRAIGRFSYGQLGTGDITDPLGVVQTLPFENIKEISSSGTHTFILFNDGTCQSFGQNNYGQLCTGTISTYEATYQTPPFNNISTIYCGSGYNTLIVFNDGTVKSCGRNNHGQLFMGTTTDYAGVVQTTPLTNVKYITGDSNVVFALLNDATTKSTGGLNNYGELGTESTGGTIGAIRTPSFTNVKEISCGSTNNAMLLNDNTMRTFGYNGNGTLGMGNKTNYGAAIQTPAFTNIKEIFMNGSIGMVLYNDGTLNTWGANHSGGLGMNNEDDYGAVIQTPPTTNVKHIHGGSSHFVLLLNDGTLRSYGSNYFGQLLIGSTDDVGGLIQTPVLEGQDIDTLFLGNNISFALVTDQ